MIRPGAVSEIRVTVCQQNLELDACTTASKPVTQLASRCQVIDADGSGTIDMEEFVTGCMRFHGPAKLACNVLFGQ